MKNTKHKCWSLAHMDGVYLNLGASAEKHFGYHFSYVANEFPVSVNYYDFLRELLRPLYNLFEDRRSNIAGYL